MIGNFSNEDKIYIGLGSNLSFEGIMPNIIIDEAIKIISKKAKIISVSSKYISKAWPIGTNAPDYINMVIAVKSKKTPFKLMADLMEIEKKFGRIRNENNKWAARTLDLDIIDFKGQIIDRSENHIELNLPHPRMELRDFVLLPLQEIAPNWVHSKLKQSINQLLNDYVSQNGQYSAIKCQTA